MKHVLVVDDSPETREIIQMVFVGIEDEIQIDFAVNSKQAIDLFNNNSYSACILDVSLPDITGYYLGELIRKSCSDMPLAFLTNYEGSFTKENAELINASYWAKSEVFSNPMQLREIIAELATDVDCSDKVLIEQPAVLKQIS
jgi:CheY-like chemotaxis protein